MNNNLVIAYEDNKKLILEWDKNDLATEYELVGLNKLFIYEEITRTKTNKLSIRKDKIKNYIELRINYILNDKRISKEIILSKSNRLPLAKKEFETISIKCIKSYSGLTLSFDTQYIYDKYYLYVKDDNVYKLLMVIEDPQVNSTLIEENKVYMVEAYNKENNDYVIKAKSNDYTCVIETVPKINGKPKISVAVPVFNSEGFIARCVDSVLLSTMHDIEVILIDDESTDNSPAIIDWYSKYYDGIVRSYHQKNIGVSGTRNRGIELATGDYIGLMDNDDLVHPRMYEELYEGIKKYNAPIAIAKTLIREDIENTNICLDVPNDKKDRFKLYTYEEMFKYKNERDIKNIYFVAVWNKIIRADIIKDHLFPSQNHYEDSTYTKMIYSYMDNFVFAFDAYYIWDKRRRKTTGTASTYNYNEKEEDKLLYHRLYCNSTFYAAKEGNIDRINYVIYDAIKESLEYLTETNCKNSDNDIYNLYKDAIKEVNSRHNILDVDLIKNDEEVKAFAEEMLK